MLTQDLSNKYQTWLANATADQDLITELKAMDEAKIEDSFYRDLAFGTGGLRGVIGAGTNRMNVYTVAKASQGLADYVNSKPGDHSIAVSYDSRIKSDLFSRTASAVFAANGIKVHLYTELMPTPCLSYAVRALGCDAGIMVTASHNPSKYNGYKVYGADGCQITTEAAAEILAKIEAVDVFEGVKNGDFDTFLAEGKITYIGEEVYTGFVEEVKKQSVLFGDEIDRDVAIVYTPLNGAGLKPVTRALKETGFTNITIVSEQEKPDGNFPTCPYPNPEIKEAMQLGMEYAAKTGADLLLATDPDSDRCGIAVKDNAGEYKLVTGNEVFVKTIVTMDLAEKIAESYGVRTINVLTGFKFIGEQIGMLEANGKADSYIFGFEESYGYLTGSYVRDKDAVDAAFMICEMFAFYKTRGISILDKLDELYAKFGYCLNTLHSYEFEGSAGFAKMQDIMKKFREGKESFGDKKTVSCKDYSQGIDGLPASDVLKFFIEDGSVVVRPSGTEPKLKTYISVLAIDKAQAGEIAEKISQDLEEYMR